LTDVASVSLENSGPFVDFLSGLDNVRLQNEDVILDASANGLLSFAFTKIYSGVDPQTQVTLSASKIVRRDYQITYE
jgi:hypothetical protein